MVVRKQGSCEDLRESCTRKETRLRPPTNTAAKRNAHEHKI